MDIKLNFCRGNNIIRKKYTIYSVIIMLIKKNYCYILIIIKTNLFQSKSNI